MHTLSEVDTPTSVPKRLPCAAAHLAVVHDPGRGGQGAGPQAQVRQGRRLDTAGLLARARREARGGHRGEAARVREVVPAVTPRLQGKPDVYNSQGKRVAIIYNALRLFWVR